VNVEFSWYDLLSAVLGAIGGYLAGRRGSHKLR
jgi:hypothetical protein